jgi:hypothetical protein
MHARTSAWVRLLAVTALLVACDDNGPDDDEYRATLNGTSEVPANQSTATGSFTMQDDGDEFEYRLTVQNIASPTAAHIHIGPPGVNGGILVPLFSNATPPATFSGTLSDDAFTAADIQVLPGAAAAISVDSLRVLLRTGGAYVNVHTTARPAGEIRGQIVR